MAIAVGSILLFVGGFASALLVTYERATNSPRVWAETRCNQQHAEGTPSELERCVERTASLPAWRVAFPGIALMAAGVVVGCFFILSMRRDGRVRRASSLGPEAGAAR